MRLIIVINPATQQSLECNIVNQTANYINLNPVNQGSNLLSVDKNGNISYVPSITQVPANQFVQYVDVVAVTPEWPDLTYIYTYKAITVQSAS